MARRVPTMRSVPAQTRRRPIAAAPSSGRARVPSLRGPLRQGDLPRRLPREELPVRLLLRGFRPHLRRLHAEGLRGRDRPRHAAGRPSSAAPASGRFARCASRCRCAGPRSRTPTPRARTRPAASTPSSASCPSASRPSASSRRSRPAERAAPRAGGGAARAASQATRRQERRAASRARARTRPRSRSRKATPSSWKGPWPARWRRGGGAAGVAGWRARGDGRVARPRAAWRRASAAARRSGR